MTVRFEIGAGNTLRSTVNFTPESPGTVALANVTARVKVPTAIDPDGYLDLTAASAYSTGVVAGTVAGGVYPFSVDILVPDTAAAAGWRVRWESNTPSAKIAVEDETTVFQVVPSQLPTP